jgi:hypothetical protein
MDEDAVAWIDEGDEDSGVTSMTRGFDGWRKSQIRSVPSTPLLTILWPSGAKATLVTGPR